MTSRSKICYRHPAITLPFGKACPECWSEMKRTGFGFGKSPSRVYDTIEEAIEAVKSRPRALFVGVQGKKYRVEKDGTYTEVQRTPARRPTGPPKQDVEARLARYREINPQTGCWLWTAAIDRGGYGRMATPGDDRVHRVAWEFYRGPIPTDLHIDHLCRVRRCFNPDHLEPVTPAENNARSESLTAHLARQTHCKRGHEFTPDNTYQFGPDKRYRSCRACRAVYRDRPYNARHRRTA